MVETITQNILDETIYCKYISLLSGEHANKNKQASELTSSSAAMVGYAGLKYSLTLEVFNSAKSGGGGH